MKYLVAICLVLSSHLAVASNLVSLQSKHNFSKTVELLEQKIIDKKFSIFSEIDHQKGASSVNLVLNGNKLIIFGNPKGGAPLMQENSLMGIELPLKMLITEEKKGSVKVTFEDPRSYEKKYALNKNKIRLNKIYGALKSIAETVK